MSVRIGSLFSGYGGLDLGVQAAVGGDVAWHVEFDDAPSRILAHHWPDVPNYGDVTAVDWAQVPPVDVLTGGFPCQDVSLAGLRRGLKDGTRSGLWSEFARAIDALRPELVVIENVRGLLSATADRQMESSPWGVGDRHDGPALRALGAVLGDLADLGYDATWCGVRAADAGAPHGRFRVFVVARPADADQLGRSWDRAARSGWAGSPDDGRALEDAPVEPRVERWKSAPVDAQGWRSRSDAGGRGGASAADADDDSARHRWERRDEGHGWSEPAQLGGSAADTDDAAGDGERACSGSPDGDDVAPANTAGRGRDRRTQDPVRQPLVGAPAPGSGGSAREWGTYGPAVERWERVTGRVAPAPTSPTGRDGAERLSAEFVEWMMGLPAGHVTDVGLTRNEQLKALGNGVVPQQAELALRTLLTREAVAA